MIIDTNKIYNIYACIWEASHDRSQFYSFHLSLEDARKFTPPTYVLGDRFITMELIKKPFEAKVPKRIFNKILKAKEEYGYMKNGIHKIVILLE